MRFEGSVVDEADGVREERKVDRRLADDLTSDEHDSARAGAGKVSGAGVHPGDLWGGGVEETRSTTASGG